MQEPGVGDPVTLVHHFAVHDGDLRRRPAEGQQADAQPDVQRLGKGGEGGLGHAPPLHHASRAVARAHR